MMRFKRLLVLSLSTTFLLSFTVLGLLPGANSSSANAALPDLRINELMADNNGTLPNPDNEGEFDDWIELFNTGASPVDLNGYYLTDDLSDLTKHQISGTLVISSGGYLLIYADNQPELGVNHASFKLSSDGESVGLVDPDGITLVDSVTFMTQTADVSLGRNGLGDWVTYTVATPGRSNEVVPPQITSVTQNPHLPQANMPVVVSATIIMGDASAITPTFNYRIDNAGWLSVSIKIAENDVYTGSIPALMQDQLVDYYVGVQASNGLTVTNPTAAPNDFYQYVVGYSPPTIRLNEIMADNEATLEDPDEPGSFPDWIELINYGTETIELTGMQLTDDLTNRDKYVFPAGISLDAGEILLLYADNDPEEGDFHLPFSLSKNGESVALYDRVGRASNLIDQVEFGPQENDITYMRCGPAKWEFGMATPGQANSCGLIKVYLPLSIR